MFCLRDLVSPLFLEFVEKYPGKLILHMQSADIRTSPWTVALDMHGQLFMSLDWNTYTRFGLEGQPTGKKKERYLVQLDLKQAKLKDQNSKMYKRVVSCFDRLTTEAISLNILIDDQEAADTFEASFGVLHERFVEWTFKEQENILVPPFPDQLMLGKNSECSSFEDLDVWAGLLLNGNSEILSGVEQDSFICGYTLDPSTVTQGNAQLLEHNSPIHPRAILDLVKKLSGSMICIRVKGFESAPTTWDNSPNRTDDHNDASHGYTLFSEPHSGSCILLKYSSTNLAKQ